MQSLLQVVSENVRFYRKKSGLSQLKLAYQLEMSPSYLAEIERGTQYPSLKVLDRIATFFQIEPYLLLYPTEIHQTSVLTAEYTRRIRSLQANINTLFADALGE